MAPRAESPHGAEAGVEGRGGRQAGEPLRFERPAGSSDVMGRADAEFRRLQAEMQREAARRVEMQTRGVNPVEAAQYFRREITQPRMFARRAYLAARAGAAELAGEIQTRGQHSFAQIEAAAEARKVSGFQETYARMESENEWERDLCLVTIVTGRRIAPTDSEYGKILADIKQNLPADFAHLNLREQLVVARRLMSQYHSPDKPGQRMTVKEMRRAIAVFLRRSEAGRLTVAAVAETAVAREMVTQMDVGKDETAALQAGLQKAPPELRKQFEEYAERWSSAFVSDIFPPSRGADPIADAFRISGSVTNEQIASSVSSAAVIGVLIDPKAMTMTVGNIQMPIQRIFAVNGQVKVLVADRNADRGLRVVDAASPHADVRNMQIDEYFSRRFREFSGTRAENDPTAVADAALSAAVRRILPELFSGGGVEFNPNELQRAALDNLTHILLEPDFGKDMESKSAALKSLANDPKYETAMRRILTTMPAGGLAMSEFEKQVRKESGG